MKRKLFQDMCCNDAENSEVVYSYPQSFFFCALNVYAAYSSCSGHFVGLKIIAFMTMSNYEYTYQEKKFTECCVILIRR